MDHDITLILLLFVFAFVFVFLLAFAFLLAFFQENPEYVETQFPHPLVYQNETYETLVPKKNTKKIL